jgi:hypothetical protein
MNSIPILLKQFVRNNAMRYIPQQRLRRRRLVQYKLSDGVVKDGPGRKGSSARIETILGGTK